MSERAWIRTLKPGDQVDETYALRSRDVRKRRGGGDYLAMTLADRSGQVTALAWEHVERFVSRCRVGDVVRVVGQVQRYNQRLQIVVREMEPVPPGQVDETVYVRSAAESPEVLWRRLEGVIEEIADEHLRQLLFRVFADEEVATRFRTAPAARSLHHAYRSGLLEHTLSMVGAARLLARHYGLDESLVVAGCILHDLGKIWELELGPSIEYTDDGRLLGHLVLETLHLDRVISGIESFPEERRRQLLHILISHHGEYAHGSPRRPKTPEALLVHAVDQLDAQLAGMWEAIDAGGDTGEAWSAYSPMLERYVYRRRPGGDGEP